MGGVPWLISGPRKKLINIFICRRYLCFGCLKIGNPGCGLSSERPKSPSPIPNRSGSLSGTPGIKNLFLAGLVAPRRLGVGRARLVNDPATHVEAFTEMSRDAGSIPAASIHKATYE